ncbi:ATP synthase F0 subunit B [Micromonospora sp. U56]|uniref:ATP synthase F0 subunit B n=1 Tax=Micromonospora sp. U56 TaxID=2824900 RepID=UPI001B36DEA2|nr:ATP synthase F0 subunit B [Micromonospora sp. U56]MBQ0894648.1 ATP synthase F0 subunit B [Micromonospora sp. U56]
MTTHDGHLDPADPKPESLEELANEVSELADKIVAARLGNGELARRREWLKRAAAEMPIPSDVTCGSGVGDQASLPIVPLSREPRNFNWPTVQYTMTARREAASIRAQARKEAEEYQDAALRRAADTIAQARAEAQKILEKAQQEADRILDDAKEEQQRLNTAARHASNTRSEVLEQLCTVDRFSSIASQAVIDACVATRTDALARGAALLYRSESVEAFQKLLRFCRSQYPTTIRGNTPLRLESVVYEQATRAVAHCHHRAQLEVECSETINARGVSGPFPLEVMDLVRYALLAPQPAGAKSSGGRSIAEAIEVKSSPRCLNTDTFPTHAETSRRARQVKSLDGLPFLPAHT